MQRFNGREGERLTVGGLGWQTDLVGVYGRDGQIVVLLIDPGDDPQEVIQEARRQGLVMAKRAYREAERREKA